jgi:hypothetical protein
LLDGAVLTLAFWTGVAAFSGLIVPALLGAALLTYLLNHRELLRSHSKTAPGAGRV